MRQLIKCMGLAVVGLGIALLAIHGNAGGIFAPALGVVGRMLETLVSLFTLVLAFSPSTMFLAGATLVMGAGCYAWNTTDERQVGTEGVNRWARRLGITGAIFLMSSLVGLFTSDSNHNYIKENNPMRQARAQVTEAQAEAIHAEAKDTFRIRNLFPITENTLPESLIQGMNTREKGSLARGVSNLYRGISVSSAHYFSCKRLVDAYLAASPRVQGRMTLVVNGGRVDPKHGAPVSCRKLRFNSYQLGYSESRLFSGLQSPDYD